MIEPIDAPAGVVAFKAVGHVESSDYEQVLKPALEQAISGGRKARIVFVLGDEFEGYTAGAAWEDLTLWGPHLSSWERCAIVTDPLDARGRAPLLRRRDARRCQGLPDQCDGRGPPVGRGRPG